MDMKIQFTRLYLMSETVLFTLSPTLGDYCTFMCTVHGTKTVFVELIAKSPMGDSARLVNVMSMYIIAPRRENVPSIFSPLPRWTSSQTWSTIFSVHSEAVHYSTCFGAT